MTDSPRSDVTLAEGLAHHRAGALDAARASYRAALAAAPGDANALRLLGIAHLQQGRGAEAAALLRRALAERPGLTEAWADLARVLHASGLAAEAAACLRAVLRASPGDAAARRALATLRPTPSPDPGALATQAASRAAAGDHAAARALFRRAALLLPDPAAALANAANEALQLDQPEEALATLEALPDDAHPVAATVWRHRAAAFTLLDRPHDAIAACRRSLALAPGNADARFGEASALLALGDYTAGWRAYEARLGTPGPRHWLGGPSLAGRTLLLRAEQGYGDVIQFVRYAPVLRDRAGHLVLAVPRPLLRLCNGLADRVVDDATPPPPHDFATPLMSLPLALDTTLETIPTAPYLRPDPALARDWAARLGPRRGLRVGVAWTGDPATPRGPLRRVPPEALLPALAATGAELHALHKVIPPPDLPALGGVARHERNLTDFAATAALIAQLDLVVSVDTSVAHLAAALGRPTLIMLPFAADFRWLRERSDSPWYPTATLFRQQARGDWAPVIARVSAAVGQRA